MKELRGAKIRRVFIILVLLIIAFAVVYKLFFTTGSKVKQAAEQAQEATQKESGPAQQQQQAVAIKAFSVAQFDFKDYLNALGTLKGGLEFKLSFEIPGIVDSINYREGEKYQKGALLMSLKQDDILLRLRRSEAKMNRAEISVEMQKNKFQEHEKLFKIGAIPQSTLEKVRLELQAAEFEHEETSLQVRADEIILEKSNLYAPSDGMIGELNVEVGEAVTSNTLLGTHILTEYVNAEFGVIERDVSRIAPLQEALIYVDAYPGKVFKGKVENVSPIVTGTSRTASAEVKIDNTEGLLLPGMFARIKILLYEKDNAIVIPSEAVVETSGKQAVFVVDTGTNKVHLREIIVDYMQSDYTVVAQGLSANELIAITSLDELQPGQRVDVIEKQKM